VVGITNGLPLGDSLAAEMEAGKMDFQVSVHHWYSCSVHLYEVVVSLQSLQPFSPYR
jgi:hypothetical protein